MSTTATSAPGSRSTAAAARRARTRVNGNPVTSDTLIMTTANTANVQSFFPGVTFCECEFTRWGLWSAQSEQAGFADRVHLGSWVAGRVPDAVDIPTVGTATYRGHVIASMANNGNQYLAAGNLVNTINFANRTGSAAVTNLDGQNYAGLLTVSGNGLGGLLTSGTGPAADDLLMVGSLFKGTMHPSVGEMGGLVLINANQQSVSSLNYTGSGIFTGRMTGSAASGHKVAARSRRRLHGGRTLTTAVRGRCGASCLPWRRPPSRRAIGLSASISPPNASPAISPPGDTRGFRRSSPGPRRPSSR